MIEAYLGLGYTTLKTNGMTGDVGDIKLTSDTMSITGNALSDTLDVNGSFILDAATAINATSLMAETGTGFVKSGGTIGLGSATSQGTQADRGAGRYRLHDADIKARRCRRDLGYGLDRGRFGRGQWFGVADEHDVEHRRDGDGDPWRGDADRGQSGGAVNIGVDRLDECQCGNVCDGDERRWVDAGRCDERQDGAAAALRRCMVQARLV